MRILLAAARFVVLVAFMPQSLMADLITTQQRVQCKPMHIYDPLGIRGGRTAVLRLQFYRRTADGADYFRTTCMRKYFDLCLAKTEEAEESVRAAAANFGRCMANSSYSWIFNPTAKVPTRSEVCQHRMTTNIVVFPRFQECYKKLNDICHGWDENNRVKNLVLMIDGAKVTTNLDKCFLANSTELSESCKTSDFITIVKYGNMRSIQDNHVDSCTHFTFGAGIPNISRNIQLNILGNRYCLLEGQKLYQEPKLWNLVACSAFEVLYDKTKAPILDALLEFLQCKRPKPTVATAALRAPDC